MEYRKFQNKIIVRMDKGEEILEKVKYRYSDGFVRCRYR